MKNTPLRSEVYKFRTLWSGVVADTAVFGRESRVPQAARSKRVYGSVGTMSMTYDVT